MSSVSRTAISTETIIDLNVTTAKINNLAVTTAKIADSNITTVKILDGAVTNSKLASTTITTSKINNNAVTSPKLSNLNFSQSITSGVSSTTSLTYVDVINLSVSITTIGRPVWVGICPDSSTSNSSNTHCTAGLFDVIYIKLLRDSTDLYEDWFVCPPQGCTKNIFVIDTPSAGTYTYKIQHKSRDGDGVFLNYFKLKAFEL